MTPFVHSLALLVLATLVAASTPPAATPVPRQALLFALQASAARNATGHENLKAVLQQPEGAAWHLDVAAEEQRATGGERIRITTFALSADAEAVGEGGKGDWAALEVKMATLTMQVAEQNETIVELRASNEELKASIALMQGQQNSTSNEHEEGDAAGGGGGRSARVMLQKELATVAAMRAGIAKMEAANAEMAAANAVTQQRLDAVEVALQHHLHTATTASPTTSSTVSAPPSPTSAVPSTSPPTPPPRRLTDEERRALSEKLKAAARRGAVQEMRQLLTEGADAQYQNSAGETALQGAAEEGHVDAVRLLLVSGALVDVANSGGNTALNFAAWTGHAACVDALLADGADVESRNSWGHTPLRDAAEGNHEAVVRALLAAGADPGVKDDDRKTARDVTTSGAIRAMLAARAP